MKMGDIDIDDIQLVINFDVPHDAEDYVHRIGRTARANNDGEAITLVSEKDQQRFASIEHFLETEIEKRPLPEGLGEGPAYRPKEGGEKRYGGRRNQGQRNGYKRRNKNQSKEGQSQKKARPNANSRRSTANRDKKAKQFQEKKASDKV